MLPLFMLSQIFGGEHYAFTAMRHIWKFSQLCRWNKVCSFHTYELETNLVASIFFYKNKQDTWFQLTWAGDIFGVLDFLSQIYTFSHIFAVDIFLADYYRLWPRVSNCIISGHREKNSFKKCVVPALKGHFIICLQIWVSQRQTSNFSTPIKWFVSC